MQQSCTNNWKRCCPAALLRGRLWAFGLRFRYVGFEDRFMMIEDAFDLTWFYVICWRGWFYLICIYDFMCSFTWSNCSLLQLGRLSRLAVQEQRARHSEPAIAARPRAWLRHIKGDASWSWPGLLGKQGWGGLQQAALESTCRWPAHGCAFDIIWPDLNIFDLSLLVCSLCHPLNSGRCGSSLVCPATRSQSSGMPWRLLSAAWNDEIVPGCASVLRWHRLNMSNAQI